MYGIFTYIWVIFRANVGKYSIHGASGHRIHGAAIYGAPWIPSLYPLDVSIFLPAPWILYDAMGYKKNQLLDLFIDHFGLYL